MKQRIPVFAHTIDACRLQAIGMDTYITRVKNRRLESDYGNQA